MADKAHRLTDEKQEEMEMRPRPASVESAENPNQKIA